MLPADAARILELSIDSTPDQIEARFLDLRRKLEDKIAKAPTPGLQAKYRNALNEVTEAFETLTIAADSSSLPVLVRRDPAGAESILPAPAGRDTSPPPAAPAATVSVASPAPAARRPKLEHRKSNKEFFFVAVLALAILGAGGWWVVKMREEKTEKARLAAEAEAAAQLKKKIEEEEQDRLNKLATRLRTTLAEIRVSWEAFESEVRDAERRASEAKTELRGFREGPATKKAELSALATGHELFTTWLKGHLVRHPAKVARARAEQLLDARAVDEAEAAVSEIRAAMAGVEQEIEARKNFYIGGTGSITVQSKPTGMAYVLVDSWGREHTGRTPNTISGLPLTHVPDPQSTEGKPVKLGEFTSGEVQVTFSRVGWNHRGAKAQLTTQGEMRTLSAEFPEGVLAVDSLPSGIPFVASNALGWSASGKTPATLNAVPPSRVTVKVSRAGYQDASNSVDVAAGKTATVSVDQRPQDVKISVAEEKSKIFVDGRFAGYREATVTGLTPGEHALQIEAEGYVPYRKKFNVRQGGSAQVQSYSFRELAAQTLTCSHCSGSAYIQRSQRCTNCEGRSWHRCFQCNGTGRVGLGTDWNPYVTCPSCRGNGNEKCDQCKNGTYYWQDLCKECSGDGRRSQLEMQ